VQIETALAQFETELAQIETDVVQIEFFPVENTHIETDQLGSVNVMCATVEPGAALQ